LTLSLRLRAALKLHIEMGDIRLSSKVAGMSVDEFRELLRRSRNHVVV